MSFESTGILSAFDGVASPLLAAAAVGRSADIIAERISL